MASQESKTITGNGRGQKTNFTSILSEEELERESKESNGITEVFISPPTIVLSQSIADNFRSLLMANRPGILLSALISTYNKVHKDQQIELKQFGVDRTLLFIISQPSLMKLYYSVTDDDLKVVDTEFEMGKRELEKDIMGKLEADKYGYYSLHFPRFMLVENTVQKDLERQLRRVSRISLSEKNVYARFKKKWDAARCLMEFSGQIGMRITIISQDFKAEKKDRTALCKDDDPTESTQASEANKDETPFRVILGNISLNLTKEEIERRIQFYNPINIDVFIRRKPDKTEIKNIHAVSKFAPWDRKKAEEMVKDLHHKKWKGNKRLMTCYIKEYNKEGKENGNGKEKITEGANAGKPGVSSTVMTQNDLDDAGSTSRKKFWWKKRTSQNEDEEEIDYDATGLFV